MDVRELVKRNNSISQYKEKCINSYANLLNVEGELNKLLEESIPTLIEKGIKEAIEFFKGAGFEITELEGRYMFNLDNTCIQYISNVVDKDVNFHIEIQPNNIYRTIQIKKPSRYWPMFSLVNHIKLNDEPVLEDNYESAINNCNNLEELDRAYKQLKENIDNYEKTILDISKINYIYSIYDTGIECDTFKELFEGYIIG